MPRNLKIILGVLALAVVVGLISFRSLHRRMQRLAESRAAEEQARHAVLAPPISTPTDVVAKAKIFWAAGADRVAAVEVEMPLSADPVERARQLLQALISNPPTAGQRTLPADATLSGFYILPDGTAIANFSDAISSEMPSGILSEETAVNSIARTLESNVAGLRRLKILIHGQEVETLAGNVDLTGFFDLNSVAAPAPVRTVSPAPPAPSPAH
ncbi:MAG TPA: GerMN domain-containing protein [Verrucomicrobiae bacterium]|nr:GerMN domain-containing protein [Verrucomicrobiae bacterium]